MGKSLLAHLPWIVDASERSLSMWLEMEAKLAHYNFK